MIALSSGAPSSRARPRKEVTVTRSRIAAVAGLALLSAAPAAATPRYSAVVGQKCSLCHVNPTGGGLRDPYATQYLVPTRLAIQRDGDTAGPTPSPQIGDDVLVGADLRTMWLQRDDRDTGDNFREMQASVYLALSPGDPRYRIYVHQDFGQLNEAVEAWGLGWVLPASGYVKVGRFVPAFGWKVADHRSFTRRDFVFLPAFPPHSDTGVEVGVYPGAFSAEASVLNGQFGSGADTNDSVALAVRGAWRWSRGPNHAVVGGSWYRSREAGETDAVGAFAAARRGRVVWLGELDWSRRRPSAIEPRIWRLISSQQLSVRIVQGLDALLTYDFYDPDVDLATGALHRVGLGVDALALPFLELSAKVNLFAVDQPATGSAVDAVGESDDFVQTELQVHVLY
jgi:hypothetical protein